MQNITRNMQTICRIWNKICKIICRICKKYVKKYANPFWICRIVTSRYSAYFAYIYTPHFADAGALSLWPRYLYMTRTISKSASWIFDIEAQMLFFDIGYEIDLPYRRIYSDIEYSNIRYSSWSTARAQKWKMADIGYMWTTRYRRTWIFDIEYIFFDILLLRYWRIFYSIGIQNI